MSGTYTPVKGSRRAPVAGAQALGRANPHATIEVSLKLRRKNELPDPQGAPAKTMTRTEFAASYGASQADVDKVTQVLSGFGLAKVGENQSARTLRFSGTVANMESAFQTRLINYAAPSGNYRGRMGPLQVPSELKDIVQGVFGLDNRRVALRRRKFPHATGAHGKDTIPASWYTPAELAKRYNFPAGDGAGQTVGLLEFGGGFFADDLKMFCNLAGVPVPKVKTVSVDGTPTDSVDGTEGETMLDVEVVAGVCPKSTIVVYFSHWDDQGWLNALDAAVHDSDNDPGVVSISWGNAEDTDIWTDQTMAQVNETLKDAVTLGVTICVASGDDGSSDAIGDGHAHADFPGSSPYVLSVGGTTIPSKTSTGDIVWKEGDGLRSDGGGSTGGGVSAVFPRPDWQKDITIQSVNTGAIVGRCVPDVAANADWTASPYLLVVDGKSEPNGGTSAASPLWAALITLINAKRGNRIGYLTPLLYQTDGNGTTIGATGCNDIQSGDNNTDQLGGYKSGPGYDAVSGWGTPNGAQLLAALGDGTAALAA